ncbi:MAG TPA: hypothetical protein DCP28_15305, partial [Cytophagales bacterium]|nr:hypothetical protein [Cytophagales bacterium]
MEGGKLKKGGTQIKDIFKAPLEAVIEAEIELSQKIQHFIAHYGFTGVGENGFDDETSDLQLKTVQIRYVLEGKPKVLRVPVLSLVPLPLL